MRKTSYALLIVFLVGILLSGCTASHHNSLFGAHYSRPAYKLSKATVTFKIPETGDERRPATGINIKTYLAAIGGGDSITSSTNNIAPGVEFKKGGIYGPYPLNIKYEGNDESPYDNVRRMAITLDPMDQVMFKSEVIFDSLFTDGTTCRDEFIVELAHENASVILKGPATACKNAR